MGKTEKNQNENHATKVTKIPKTKRQKYGMNETILSMQFFSHSLSNFGAWKEATKKFDYEAT